MLHSTGLGLADTSPFLLDLWLCRACAPSVPDNHVPTLFRSARKKGWRRLGTGKELYSGGSSPVGPSDTSRSLQIIGEGEEEHQPMMVQDYEDFEKVASVSWLPMEGPWSEPSLKQSVVTSLVCEWSIY